MREEVLEFGTKRENEERRDGGFGIIFNPKTQLYAVGENIGDGNLRFFGGGVDSQEDIEEGILREIIEESGLHDFLYIEKIGKVLAHYHNKPKNIDRITEATCLLIILKSANLMNTKLEEHEKFTLEWVRANKIFFDLRSRNQDKDYDHWIYFLEKSVKRIKELGFV